MTETIRLDKGKEVPGKKDKDKDKTGASNFKEDTEQLRVLFPESFYDPGSKWNELLTVEIKVDDPVVYDSLVAKARETVYKSINYICTTGKPAEIKSFTKDEWAQLLGSLVLKVLSEDETVSPYLNADLRKSIKEIIYVYVSEDKFILDVLELIASLDIEESGGDIIDSNEGFAKHVTYLASQGILVNDNIITDLIEQEASQLKMINDFLTTRVKIGARSAEGNLLYPQSIVDLRANMVNSATRAIRKMWGLAG